MRLLSTISQELNVALFMKNAREISTFKGGGSAYVFYPESLEKTKELIGVLLEENVDFRMLGNGSNMLLCDGICDSALISASKLCGVTLADKGIVCECGASLFAISKTAREHNFGGLEFLSGVPCSIGGAIKMNAGAFGAQIKDYIDTIDTLTLDCDDNACLSEPCEKERKASRLSVKAIDSKDFSYRRGARGIVLSATLRLAKIDKKKSLELARDRLAVRRAAQPCLPSLGSVFLNGEIPSGKLIDECALKGVRIGGAQISPLHGNFIVNVGGATASDYLALVNLAKRVVYEKKGIRLKEEFVTVR